LTPRGYVGGEEISQQLFGLLNKTTMAIDLTVPEMDNPYRTKGHVDQKAFVELERITCEASMLLVVSDEITCAGALQIYLANQAHKPVLVFRKKGIENETYPLPISILLGSGVRNPNFKIMDYERVEDIEKSISEYLKTGVRA
jgi:hypothetical protein